MAFFSVLLAFTSSLTTGKNKGSSADDVLIDNTPMKDMVVPFSDRNNRKTGDTSLYKEIGLSKWITSSYNSIAGMKSYTANLIIFDEFDECPLEIKDQGNVASIIEGRTMGTTFYKLVFISTPTRQESSQIYQQFIMGDQRLYHVPCPNCGEMQVMEIKSRTMNHGFKFSVQTGKNGEKEVDPKSLRYKCISCPDEFVESCKPKIMLEGEWRANWHNTEHKPVSSLHKSYQVGGLMSPTITWKRMADEFKKSDFGKNIPIYKNFTINYRGEPYSQVKRKQNYEMFKSQALDYELGTCPELDNHSLILLGGVDVQGDRLELAVYGFHYNMKMYLIDYQVFWGDTEFLTDDCYKNLLRYILNKTYTINGKKKNIVQVGVDCGHDPVYQRTKDWGAKGETIISFCAESAGVCVPIRGVPKQSQNNNVLQRVGTRRKLSKKQTKRSVRFNVFSSTVKDYLYQKADNSKGQASIFFPKWANKENEIILDDWYFQSFCSEEYKVGKNGKWGWEVVFRRNEMLDCTVYAVAIYYSKNLNLRSRNEWRFLDKK